MLDTSKISNTQIASVPSSSLKRTSCSWNGYKIAQVIALGVTSTLVATATLIAAIFSSYLLMVLTGAAFLTLACLTVLSFKYKPSEALTSSNKTTEVFLSTQKYPQTKFMTLVQKCDNLSPQGPSTVEVQAQIQELNDEIAQQQGKSVNIPLSFSLQTTEQVYEMLLTTCQQRDQLQQEVAMLKNVQNLEI